jgi:hypothetical protein
MKSINTNLIPKWNIAKKTKNIKAKPLISIMVDRSVMSKFLVDTLEGREKLGDGAIICIGESNDIWQQMPKKLIQKYQVIDVDNDGWMLCEPRPENSVECVEINDDIQQWISKSDAFVSLNQEDEFFIIGQWGESVNILGKDVQIQRAAKGDFICRNREDLTDVWIVRRKIFNNTYTIIS